MQAMKGDSQDACALLEKSTEAVLAEHGKQSHEYVNHLATLGEVYWTQGKLTEAEERLQEALAIGSSVWEELSPLHLKNLIDLGGIRAALGDHAGALKTLLNAESLQLGLLAQQLRSSTEQERLKSLRRLHRFTEIILTLVCTRMSRDQEALQAAWGLVLRRKSLGIDTLAFQRAAANQSEDPEIRGIAKEVLELRRQAVAVELKGPQVLEDGNVDFEPYGQKTHELELSIKEREERIAAAVLKDKKFISMLATTAPEITAAIPEDCTLVDFATFSTVRFDHNDAPPETDSIDQRYVAFVSSPALADVRLIDFGDSERIDQLVRSLKGSELSQASSTAEDEEAADGLSAEPEEVVGDPIGALAEEIVEPLLAVIPPGTQRLLIVPDGELSRLPFAALVNAEGLSLVEIFNICCLSTGRDLLEVFGDGEEAGPSIVVSCPDYELSEDSMPAARGAGGDSEATVGDGRATHRAISRQASDLPRGDAKFDSLPGSRFEGSLVGEILGVEPWTDRQALKERILSVESPKILHLATHGFFLESGFADVAEQLGWQVTIAAEHAIGGRLSARIQNPLLRLFWPGIGWGQHLASLRNSPGRSWRWSLDRRGCCWHGSEKD